MLQFLPDHGLRWYDAPAGRLAVHTNGHARGLCLLFFVAFISFFLPFTPALPMRSLQSSHWGRRQELPVAAPT